MSTKKQKRAEIAAKRKRMGYSATDADDADDGVAYDPQLLTIARDRVFLQAFEKKAGSLHGSITWDEFVECLGLLNITDFDEEVAKKAFTKLDLEKEDELEFEAFVHAVHGAYPTYDLLWKDLLKKKRYIHWKTLEGPYSEDQIKTILKNKGSDFKDVTCVLRCAGDMAADPDILDKDAKKIFAKLLPGLLAALRSKSPYIVRCACLCIADIAKSKKKCLQSQIAKILNVCWEVLDSKYELAKYSATMCSKVLLKYVPDDGDNKVLKTLIQGTNLKDFPNVQTGCYEGIKVYLKKAANPKSKVTPNKEFWDLTKKVITDGLKTDDKDERQRSYEMLVLFEKGNEKKASRVTAAFTAQQEKEYANIKDGGNMDEVSEEETKEESEEERAIWQPDKSKRGPRELSRNYDDRKEQLSESFDSYDDEGEGMITTDRCIQFLRDLFEITGKDADIAIKGLDKKMDGHIRKAPMMRWSLAHSWKETRKNKYLEKEGDVFGYKSSNRDRLQERLELFQKLKEIELAEYNYGQLFAIDHRMCVLNYFIKQKK